VREVVDFVVLFFIYKEHNTGLRRRSQTTISASPRSVKKLTSSCGKASRILGLPALHGVCAIGTKIAFYHYDNESIRRLELASIPSDPYVLLEYCPKEWWHYDILEREGVDKFREVVRGEENV
jgi:hypothetical protein